MPDRDSVIERLNGIHAVACEMGNDQCYLNGIGIKQLQTLINDAVELLKAQESKMLALGEIHRGTAVWLEDVDKADVILAIGGASGGGCKCFITVDDMSIAPHESDYGVRWRAWTQEPTDEQREATPWQSQRR